MRIRFSLAIGLASVLLVAAASPAAPVDYTDASGAGNWTDPAAWDQLSSYPGGNDPADTATVDDGTMTVDTDVPLMGQITINNGGTIYAYRALSSANNVVVNSGGVLRFRAEYTAGYAYYWNVTLNDGGTFYADMHQDGSMYGAITIGAAASATIKHDGGSYQSARLRGSISGPSSSTVALTRVGTSRDMQISGDCTAFKSTINVNCPVTLYTATGLGDNTDAGTVTVNSGGSLHIVRGWKTSNMTFQRDVVVNGGGLSNQVHQDHSLTWQGNIALQSDLTMNLYTAGYEHGWTYITGQITEDATPRSVHLRVTGSEKTRKEVTLENAGNNFSGGLTCTSGQVYVRQDGAQGLGGITLADNSKMLLKDNDGATNWSWTNDLAGSGTVQVEDGSGTYGLTADGSTVAAGNSAGTLTIDGGFAFANSATLVAEIVGVMEGDPAALVLYNDLLAVQNNLTGLSSADLRVVVDSTLTPGDLAGVEFTIVTAANDLTSMSFNSVTFEDDMGQPLAGSVEYGDGFVNVTIPEPATLGLVSLGFLALLRRRKRR